MWNLNIYLPIANRSVHMFLLLGLGAAVGFLAGLFGVVGGFLMTPLLMTIGIHDTSTFISLIAGDLTHNTTCYVRAYATNSNGTGYGNVESFTTLDTAYTFIADGRTYRAIPIGTQIWSTENLRVTHYQNGDLIPKLTAAADWIDTYDGQQGAYCIWDNNDYWVSLHGCLYNWYAVNNWRDLAPDGWHVPSDAEWDTLIASLGGYSIAGGQMKEAGTLNWDAPNAGATNSSGFTAIGAGYRKSENGDFASDGYVAIFWSSTGRDETNAFTRALYADQEGIYRRATGDNKMHGFSVRLVKD